MNFEKLEYLVTRLKYYQQNSGCPDNIIQEAIIDFLVMDSKDKNIILNLILNFQKVKDEINEKKQQTLYTGLESAFFNFMTYVDKIEQYKTTPKNIKEISELYFNNKDGSVAWIIYIAKAYFPLGHSNGHSQCGIQFFEKFKTLLMENKDRYLNGESKEWAERQDLYDYIKLVVDNIENGDVK
jgi:hypothetical protein